MQLPRYIAIEGPIGVGKTTLANRLCSRIQARKVLEIFEENPFLARFYKDRQRFAFQTEMFFLLSRYRQQTELSQQDLFAKHTISDYLFVKTRLFATLTLAGDELGLYERVYTLLEAQVPKPDLVVYLHADLEVLLHRIRQRGRAMEQDMDPVYLADLCRIYANYFRDYRETPLLIVNGGAFNFDTDPQALEALLEAIRAMEASRSYLEGPSTLIASSSMPFPPN